MRKRSLSPSSISESESESESEFESESESEDLLTSRHAYHGIEDDKNVLYQPPHPQHIPSSLEIAQANARIADQEVKLAELNAKLDELARDTLLLTRKRDAAVQAVRNERSFIAGKCLSRNCCRVMNSCTFVVVRKVPTDVLEEIFLFYLASGPSCSPWTLTTVSRTFRVTAFSTPRLWGRITITTEEYSHRWMYGSEQCNTLPRLQRALARAAAAPLDIIVNLKIEPYMDSKKEKELLWTLFRTSSRWVSLETKDISIRHLDLRCIEKEYGSLESPLMACATTQRLIQAIARSSPNLTALRAEYVQSQITNSLAFSWWSRLTTLFYRASHRDDNPTDRIRILDSIIQCKLLRQLTLSMNTLRFTTDEIALYNSRSLPNLRKLYFVNVNCAMLFECPNLTHLSYKTNNTMAPCTATTAIHSTNEFRLEHLMYCEVDSPFKGQYLAPLAAPNVQELRIATAWTSLGVGMLESTLEKMGGLKNLKITRIGIAKAGLEIFVIDPRDRKRSILCPKLVTLDVHCWTPRDVDLKPILKKVAESRHIAGIPLASITYGNSSCERWTCVKGDSGSSSLPIYSFHPLT